MSEQFVSRTLYMLFHVGGGVGGGAGISLPGAHRAASPATQRIPSEGRSTGKEALSARSTVFTAVISIIGKNIHNILKTTI